MSNSILSAQRLNKQVIQAEILNQMDSSTSFRLVSITDGTEIPIRKIRPLKNKTFLIITSGLIISENYRLELGHSSIEVQLSNAYWSFFKSNKTLGLTWKNQKAVFRVFAPRAKRVLLCLFQEPFQEPDGLDKYPEETQIDMKRDRHGVWEIQVQVLNQRFYGYRVYGPAGPNEKFNPSHIASDPYSRLTVSRHVAPMHYLSVITRPTKFFWKSKKRHIHIQPEEMILYECHVRDMTMLSPDLNSKGTYRGLTEKGKTGGLSHILNLGVNSVELLPVQEFDEIELPYLEPLPGYGSNDFNPFGRNHWGYMTNCFFAPESFYVNGEINKNQWCGMDFKSESEFKQLVDAFHQEGLSVLMDVVYNHASQYGRNSLKLIDSKYYFWHNQEGRFEARSGCGNDLKSDRPMVRRLIIDSLLHWSRNYRIDGFRFDLGTLIDWKTYKDALRAVRKDNPKTIFTAEPWMGGRGGKRDGGDYALLEGKNKFSDLGIACWNDHFRNLVRGGANAWYGSDNGLIFGNASAADLKKAVLGYPNLFRGAGHACNYIESHDNHTLGDFIRIGNRIIRSEEEIFPENYLSKCRLDNFQLSVHKLAALFLFTCPGMIMLHAGQEFAQMKIVYPPDSFHGKPWPEYKAKPFTIDHDTYEKDNPSNWLDWRLAECNSELLHFYRELIRFRKDNISLINSAKIQFLDGMTEEKKHPKAGLGYYYKIRTARLLILLNGGRDETVDYHLPEGSWKVVTGFGGDYLKAGNILTGKAFLPPVSGCISVLG